MKKYIVRSIVTISCAVYVEADSPEEARELATNSPMRSLCHQCAGTEEGCWNTSGEFDGIPEESEYEVEEVEND